MLRAFLMEYPLSECSFLEREERVSDVAEPCIAKFNAQELEEDENARPGNRFEHCRVLDSFTTDPGANGYIYRRLAHTCGQHALPSSTESPPHYTSASCTGRQLIILNGMYEDTRPGCPLLRWLQDGSSVGVLSVDQRIISEAGRSEDGRSSMHSPYSLLCAVLDASCLYGRPMVLRSTCSS